MAEISGGTLKELEIPRLIGDAGHALEKLNKEVEGLRERLNPVLNPASSPQEGNVKEPEPATQVGENLQGLLRSIGNIHDKIWDIDNRLEV